MVRHPFRAWRHRAEMSPRAGVRCPPALWVLVALMWLAGCSASDAVGRHSALPPRTVPSGCVEDCGGSGFWERKDDFQILQQAAGLDEGSWHEAGEELETGDAQELWEALAGTATTLQTFGPRRSLIVVLRQVLTQHEDVPYAELLERLRPFSFLAVMRPDGYLASAVTGQALQRMGRVELRDGRLMAGTFEVGAFYKGKSGVFYAVDDSLQKPGAMKGELGLERDWFNAALDGSEDALGEMAQALAQFIHDPIRSIEGLQQLPSAVAALMASSPAYFARYSALPLQEQIREASRISTHLLMLYGSAAGTATRLGTTGMKVPVLSLTAEGALAIDHIALPVGATAAVVGPGAGAVYVLMEASGMKGAGGGFKPFTDGNFRENLARLTGKMPEGAHAHHVFPQQFIKDFLRKGINIHDPRFGSWWERTSHLRRSFEYNTRWQEFLSLKNPTVEEILQFGRELGGEFGFQIHF